MENTSNNAIEDLVEPPRSLSASFSSFGSFEGVTSSPFYDLTIFASSSASLLDLGDNPLGFSFGQDFGGSYTSAGESSAVFEKNAMKMSFEGASSVGNVDAAGNIDGATREVATEQSIVAAEDLPTSSTASGDDDRKRGRNEHEDSSVAPYTSALAGSQIPFPSFAALTATPVPVITSRILKKQRNAAVERGQLYSFPEFCRWMGFSRRPLLYKRESNPELRFACKRAIILVDCFTGKVTKITKGGEVITQIPQAVAAKLEGVTKLNVARKHCPLPVPAKLGARRCVVVGKMTLRIARVPLLELLDGSGGGYFMKNDLRMHRIPFEESLKLTKGATKEQASLVQAFIDHEMVGNKTDELCVVHLSKVKC